MFKDRNEAGVLLAERLKKYEKNKDAIVLGLPRGGVVVAYEVAKALSLPLDIIVTRKIGMPGNPEAAIGAITVDGEEFFDQSFISAFQIERDYIDREVKKEKKEAERRLRKYRGMKDPLDLKGKIAILIDDGIATGATMRASISSAKAKGAKKIVVAVPVMGGGTSSPPEFLGDIKNDVDEIICIKTPQDFVAVGAFYEEFSQVEDGEVIRLLAQFN